MFSSEHTAPTTDCPPKYKRLEPGAKNPFIDAEGYRTYVEQKEQAFLATLTRQRENSK